MVEHATMKAYDVTDTMAYVDQEESEEQYGPYVEGVGRRQSARHRQSGRRQNGLRR
jgi:hypothetical protein